VLLGAQARGVAGRPRLDRGRPDGRAAELEGEIRRPEEPDQRKRRRPRARGEAAQQVILLGCAQRKLDGSAGQVPRGVLASDQVVRPAVIDRVRLEQPAGGERQPLPCMQARVDGATAHPPLEDSDSGLPSPEPVGQRGPEGERRIVQRHLQKVAQAGAGPARERLGPEGEVIGHARDQRGAGNGGGQRQRLRVALPALHEETVAQSREGRRPASFRQEAGALERVLPRAPETGELEQPLAGTRPDQVLAPLVPRVGGESLAARDSRPPPAGGDVLHRGAGSPDQVLRP